MRQCVDSPQMQLPLSEQLKPDSRVRSWQQPVCAYAHKKDHFSCLDYNHPVTKSFSRGVGWQKGGQKNPHALLRLKRDISKNIALLSISVDSSMGAPR
ncbi:hypothetical protein TNIN_250731 [Trichonephila inaurata madagascariensis]|uniref:Uncharacterized protein n=1 Tax=Trichonephila inaurata madagascariensis TaxID=2747483 RepID=A0A8X6Y8X7_9ARAC|nr:hypothetical protein TNIN_250731 [Trichonephila inaurata madagascariensis]